MLSLLLLGQLMGALRGLELSAKAVLGGDLQGHTGAMVAHCGEVRCEDVALGEAASHIWKCCVRSYPSTIC